MVRSNNQSRQDNQSLKNFGDVLMGIGAVLGDIIDAVTDDKDKKNR